MNVMCSKAISNAIKDQKNHYRTDILKYHGTHEDQEEWFFSFNVRFNPHLMLNILW